MTDRSKAKVVDVSVDETVIPGGRAFLHGVYVNTTLSAHDLPIKNGSGGETYVTIPASATAGQHFPLPGIEFEDEIVVDPNNAAAGEVVLAYSLAGH